MNWMHAVTRLPLLVSFASILVLSIVIPWLAVRLVRRLWPHPVLEASNELVGFTYAVFGLIYGVLLAYTIVVAWQRFDETEKDAAREATILSELWRDAQAFSFDTRSSVHLDLMNYTRSVAEEEWPTMAEKGQPDPRTIVDYEQLWSLSYLITPENKTQEAFLQQFLERMNELSSARRLRIIYSRNEVHAILWVVLMMGSILTVGYTLLFSSKHALIHTVITSCIMLMSLLGLLVILSLQYPFTGEVSVRPEVFHELLLSFRLRTLPHAMLLR